MAEFIKAQLDYVYFVYGFSFFLLASVCFLLVFDKRQRLQWMWLGIFAVICGISEWFGLVTFCLFDNPVLSVVRLLLGTLSCAALFEFVRRNARQTIGVALGLWVYVPCFALLALFGNGDLRTLNNGVHYLLGFPAAFLTACIVWNVSRTEESVTVRPWLVVFSAAMLFYAFVAGVIVSKAAYFPASVFNREDFFRVFNFPVQVVCCLCVLIMVFSLWLSFLNRIVPLKQKKENGRFFVSYWIAGCLVVSMLIGWFFVHDLTEYGHKQIIQDSNEQMGLLVLNVEGPLRDAERASKLLAVSPAVLALAENVTDENIENAAGVLDRHVQFLEMEMAYLMDTNGKTIVSSNRDTPESLVGKTFSFRPYFKTAQQGKIGQYFAAGMVTGRRGYFVATPVFDKHGVVKLVAVVKKRISDIEKVFIEHPLAFFVDSRGVIFLTSRKDLLYRSLFTLTPDIRQEIIASAQFTKPSLTPILQGDASLRQQVFFEGKPFYAFRRIVTHDGWSIVLLFPNQKVYEYRFFGLSVTFFLGIICAIFFFVLMQKERHQQELFLSLAKLQSMMDTASHVGIVITDAHGVIQSANKTIELMTGYSVSDLVNKETTAIFRRKQDISAWAQELEEEYKRPVSGFDVLVENAKEKGFDHKEWIFVRKDQTLISVDASVSVLRDYNGAITGYVAMFVDITERKKTEESLRRSQTGLADAQRMTHVGSWEFDVMTGAGYCSEELFRIYGLTPEPSGNATLDLFMKYIPPDERKKLLDGMIAPVIPPVYEFEHHVRRDDGSVRVVLQKGVTKVNEEGKLVTIIGTTQDITERKQIEESLRFIQFCVDRAGEAILWVDESSSILYANEMAQRVYGYTQHEMLALKVSALDPTFTPEVWVQHWKNVRARKLLIFETTNRAKNGRSFPMEITENFVYYGGKEYIIVFLRDITERKLAQEKILKARDYYLHLFEDFPTPIWRAGTDGTCNYFNKSWLSFTGRSLEQEFGGGWLEGIHPDDRQRFMTEYETAFQGRKPFEVEYRLGYRDGTYRWVIQNGRPFTGLSGEFVGYIGSCYDISERKRVEEALKQSEERFKIIAENAGEWIWEVNGDGLFTYSNHTIKQLLGYDMDEIIGKKYIYDFFPPEERESLRKLILEGFKEKVPIRNLVNSNMHKNGNRVIINTTGIPLLDKQGNLLGYRGVNTDISERIRMEEELRNSQIYLDAILNTIADPIFVKDRQHRWVFMNNAMCEFMGHSRDELLGKSDYDFFPKDEADVFWEKDEIVFDEAKENVNEELFTDAKGVVHTIVTKKSLYHSVEGTVHLVGVIRDITAMKKAQEEIVKAQAQYTELINNLTVGIYRNTPGVQGRYLEVNAAMVAMFEAESKAEFLSHMAVENYKDPEKRLAFSDKLMKQGFINNEEAELVTLKGRTFWASISAVMKKDEQGNVFFDGIVEDITERKKTQEELVLAYSKLQQTQRELIQTEKMASLGRFSAGVAHEIRNPLAIILGGAEFLESSLEALDKNVKTVLVQMKDAVMRANIIVKGLLRFARQSELVTERVKVSALIQDTLELFRYRAPLENIAIETEYDDHDAYINVDKNQIQQVFFNVLMNALEAMPHGGRIRVRTYHLLPLAAGASVDKSSVVICFEDSGEGISQENMQKLFEPFFTTKRDNKGTGLGLSISKSIVENHAGRIVIDSTQNKGTQVMIIMPVA